MTDERFDEVLRAVAQSWNPAPVAPPYEKMWQAIERELVMDAASKTLPAIPFPARRRASRVPTWLQMAAVLILGIALGRASHGVQSNGAQLLFADRQPAPNTQVPYNAVTSRYLGETAALLIALPTELRSAGVDSAFRLRADELLLQTRLLLDSPAAGDPVLRTLFEDLEMVLVQVVRLRAGQDSTRIELLNEALEHGNVIPRLRTAVVEHIGD